MTTMKPCPKCHSTEHLRIEVDDDDSTAGRSVKAGCTGCHAFAQIDLHAGHIDNGRVFACEKGKPPMREAKYHRGHCGPVVIFIEKCEPGVTGR